MVFLSRLRLWGDGRRERKMKIAAMAVFGVMAAQAKGPVLLRDRSCRTNRFE
jgi:hypothetical protein